LVLLINLFYLLIIRFKHIEPFAVTVQNRKSYFLSLYFILFTLLAKFERL